MRAATKVTCPFTYASSVETVLSTRWTNGMPKYNAAARATTAATIPTARRRTPRLWLAAAGVPPGGLADAGIGTEADIGEFYVKHGWRLFGKGLRCAIL